MQSNKSVMFGAWAGVFGLVMFGMAQSRLMANFLPPPSPTLSAASNAAIYVANANGIRIGAAFMMVAASALLAFAAAISAQLRRIERQVSPHAYTQIAAATIVSGMLVFAAVLWLVATFRPDRPPAVTQVVGDIAWIFLATPAPLGIIQQLAIALAIFSDTKTTPTFPRWIAYVNIVTGLSYIPGMFAGFLFTGPFAWDGALAFWLPAGGFGIWVCTMFWGLLRAARHPSE